MREALDDEWRRLLRGGFAGETAPFAIHPLDKRRAERAFFVSVRAGVDLQEVLNEAERHLLGHNFALDAVTAELSRVRQFWCQFRVTGTAKSRWLVFWNSTENPFTHSTDNLVGAFDPRISMPRLTDFMTTYHLTQTSSAAERIFFATRRKKNPYQATFAGNAEWTRYSYTCGHNPWLEARFCEGIEVFSLPDGRQTVTWKSDSLNGPN